MILQGKHLINACTKQQSIVATSSAEAELIAGNRAAAGSLGVQAVAKDLGRAVPVRRLGKAKHIEIQHLWLQEAVRNNKLTVEKIPSKTNSSDLGTKREIGDVDEARELLLVVTAIQVGLALELNLWIGDLAHSRLRSRGSDRDPLVYRNTRLSPSRTAGQYTTR